MNEIQIFNYNDRDVRTIVIDSEPWFVLKDVCDILGISNSRDVTSRLDDDEKGVESIDTPGGKQQMTVINESGLYSVVLRSDKPEAKPFQKWVTREVLPSIRKNGGYLRGQDEMTEVELMAQAVVTAKRIIEEREERIAALLSQNELMTPKAEYYDELVDGNLLTNFRDAATELGMRQSDFVRFLEDNGYIYRTKKTKRIRPYVRRNKGLFEMKEFKTENGFVNTQTLITVKGRDKFRREIKGGAATWS